jgi:hypothetical protein
VDKKALSERDICTKFISPAIERAGWDMQTQLREEVHSTNGRIMVRGRMTKRAPGKRVDYILFYKPNIPSRSSRPRTTTTASATACSRPSSTRRGGRGHAVAEAVTSALRL